MKLRIAWTVIVFSACVSGQIASQPPLVGLVFPLANAPVTVEQVEERTSRLSDGTSEAVSVRGRVFRDSAGRIRTEVDQPGVPVEIVDLSASSISMLFREEKLAACMTAQPADGKPMGVAMRSMDAGLPAGTKWTARTENLGTRVIDGVSCEGTRMTRVSLNDQSLTAVEERWFSKELGLTLLAEASGPNGKHTTKLHNISCTPPDPSLFQVPADYIIREFGAPDADRSPR